MNCQKCGHLNLDTNVQCSSCGAVLAAPMPPPPPGGAAPYRPGPPNHLVWAILATLFCCLPGGIVAIVYAAQVDSKHAAGDYAGALASSNNAKLWSWISFGIGISGLLIWFGLMMVGVMAEGAGY